MDSQENGTPDINQQFKAPKSESEVADTIQKQGKYDDLLEDRARAPIINIQNLVCYEETAKFHLDQYLERPNHSSSDAKNQAASPDQQRPNALVVMHPQFSGSLPPQHSNSNSIITSAMNNHQLDNCNNINNNNNLINLSGPAIYSNSTYNTGTVAHYQIHSATTYHSQIRQGVGEGPQVPQEPLLGAAHPSSSRGVLPMVVHNSNNNSYQTGRMFHQTQNAQTHQQFGSSNDRSTLRDQPNQFLQHPNHQMPQQHHHHSSRGHAAHFVPQHQQPANAVNMAPATPNTNQQQQHRSSRASKLEEMVKKIPKVLRDDYAVHTDQPLGKGSFGAIFIATNPSGHRFAVKFENISTDGNKAVLFYDQQFLAFLSVQHHCVHVPQFVDYGTTSFYHFLIMELCGPSVMDIFKAAPHGQMTTKTVVFLATGMLSALNAVHELKIIHRDIKPDNFVLGTLKEPTRIYMIDFGLSKQYITMGKHIKIRGHKDLTGTARYVSINTHGGLEQSRRDDLEALSYVILYLFKGGRLPWIGIQVADRQVHFRKIAEIKQQIDLNVLCEGCPEEMAPFISYCRGLPFELDPNYQYLLDLLHQISYRLNFQVEDKNLDWDLDPAFQRKIYAELSRIDYFRRHSVHNGTSFHNTPFIH